MKQHLLCYEVTPQPSPSPPAMENIKHIFHLDIRNCKIRFQYRKESNANSEEIASTFKEEIIPDPNIYIAQTDTREDV